MIEIIVELILIALHFLNKIFVLIIAVFCFPLKNRKIGKRNLSSNQHENVLRCLKRGMEKILASN